MTTDGQIQEIASCISILRPEPERMELWHGALSSGDYKFGYGLLRSGDDEYDPFGVLAAISYPDWKWDDTEDAWAIGGEALFLTREQIAEWLGIGYHDGLKQSGFGEWIDRFQKAITNAADSGTSFEPVLKLLRAGIERSNQEHKRVEQLRNDRRIGSPFSRIDEYVREERYGGGYPAFYDPRRR